MIAARVSRSMCWLLVLTGMALLPDAQANPWRNEWSFAAPPSLASEWSSESSLAFADDGDVLLLASSHSVSSDQFLRMRADGSLRWAVNLAKGPYGFQFQPRFLLAETDGGGYAAQDHSSGGYIARIGGDGTLAWSLDLPARSLVRIGPNQLVAADCRRLSLLDVDAGTVLWQRVLGTAFDCTEGSVATDGAAAIYVAYRQASTLPNPDFHVARHDLAGQLLWDQPIPEGMRADVLGVGGDLLYVRLPTELRALHVGDGSLAWAVPLGYDDRALLAGSPGEAFVIDNAAVRRLAASDGVPRWTTPVAQARESASVGDAIVVETAAGLSKLDIDDGTIVWTQALPQTDAGGHPLSYFGFGLSGSNSVLVVAKPDAAGKLPPFLQRLDLASGTLQDNPTLPVIEQGLHATSVLEESGDVIGAGLSWANELPELHLRRVDSTDGSVQWQTSVPVAIGEVPLPPQWQYVWTEAKPLMSASGSSTVVAVVLNSGQPPNIAGRSWVAVFDNATGALRWSVLLEEFEQAETIGLEPIADADGNVYFSTASRMYSPGCVSGNACPVLKLYKLAAANGTVLWSASEYPVVPLWGIFPPQPFQVIGSDVLQFGGLYSPLDDVSILRRSGVDGSIVWTRTEDPREIHAVYAAANGGLIVSGYGWAKLDASTGATIWSADCDNACGNYDQILLADGNLLSVGQVRVTDAEYLPKVSLLRNDGSGTFEHWQLDAAPTPYEGANVSEVRQDAAGAVWLRMYRYSQDSKAGLTLLAPFDVASGTLGDQQVVARKQTDIGRDTDYGDFLSAPADGSLLLDTWGAHGLSATTSGNLQLDTRITARGDIQVALDIDPTPVAPGDTLGFLATISYQGDAPVDGAAFDLYSPWPGGLVDLDCTVVSASNCTLDARTGNLHATFDLLPGAVVSISGRMKVLADTTEMPLLLTAVAYGPVGLAEPDTRNNFAGSVANDRLFADGFE